jgi:hypothetical protein
MTKTRDAAHESGDLNEKTDPRSPKKVDLHRYQVMTIPMELQQELASLKGPRLSDEEMKPLPPIEEIVKARQGTSSKPPALRAKVLQFLANHRVLLLGTALVLALGLLLVHLASREPPAPTTPVVSVNANELPNGPSRQQEPQPSSLPAPPPAVPAAAHGAGKSKMSEVPARAPTNVVSTTKPTTDASPSNDSTTKPPSRVRFKPE